MKPTYHPTDLTHADCINLYCTGAITELARAQLLQIATALTPAGTALWDQLKASGFRPTEPEVWSWLAMGSPWLPIAAAQGVVWMVVWLDEILGEAEETADA